MCMMTLTKITDYFIIIDDFMWFSVVLCSSLAIAKAVDRQLSSRLPWRVSSASFPLHCGCNCFSIKAKECLEQELTVEDLDEFGEEGRYDTT